MSEKPTFKDIKHPESGERITYENGELNVPNNPVIPFIEGDGIGRDIWKAAVRVFDAAIEKSYGGERKVEWLEVFAGEKANDKFGEWLPNDTLEAVRYYSAGIKGPLTTPVGGGIRSLNVALRQNLELYSCVRPVKFYPYAPSPTKEPEKVDFMLFRENSEDIYCGIEFAAGTPESKKLTDFINEMVAGDPSMKGKRIRENSGIGIKPSSKFAAQRLMRDAIKHAIEHNKPNVTIVHKGNIMKFTEGSFKEWCYEVAINEFRDQIVTEQELWDADESKDVKNTQVIQKGKIIVRDVIADAMLQQILLRPENYSVIVTMNLNGDYISDAAAAQVGGLGIAPGANIGNGCAIFEATHGTAPKYADKDVINPSAVILSGKMMLDWLGWTEAAAMIDATLIKTLEQKKCTYDFARQMDDPIELGTQAFADALIENM